MPPPPEVQLQEGLGLLVRAVPVTVGAVGATVSIVIVEEGPTAPERFPMSSTADPAEMETVSVPLPEQLFKVMVREVRLVPLADLLQLAEPVAVRATSESESVTLLAPV